MRILIALVVTLTTKHKNSSQLDAVVGAIMEVLSTQNQENTVRWKEEMKFREKKLQFQMENAEEARQDAAEARKAAMTTNQAILCCKNCQIPKVE